MLDLYLRANDEAEAKLALPDFLDAAGNWLLATPQWAFDPVGGIIATQPVFDGAGGLVAPAVMAPGWHANIRLLDANLLAVLQSTGLLIDPPNTPSRGWA